MYGISLTTSCDDAEVGVAWLDFCYTDEATLVGNYGIEGEALAYDENGNPTLTDLVLHNPEGKEVIVAIAEYTNYGGAMKYIADRYNSAYEDNILEAIALWGTDNDMSYILPSTLSFSNADESAEYGNILGEIKTYVEEYTNSCITGSTDPAASWEGYISRLEDMGLARATELIQGAYDDYMGKTQFID